MLFHLFTVLVTLTLNTGNIKKITDLVNIILCKNIKTAPVQNFDTVQEHFQCENTIQ